MNVDISNDSGEIVDEEGIVGVATFTMRKMGLDEECELAISVVNEERISDLHVEWMGLEGATDVLSFPMDELKPQSLEPGIVGDVVLCPQYAKKQATNGIDAELNLLTIHGVLHCLGFDHAEPSEEKVMFELQDSLLIEWQELIND
jgi:probable rRNA maturation factor